LKFKFPFQNVLGYRKTLENIAQKNFQEAVSELNTHRQKLSDMHEQIALARENAFQKQVQGGSAAPALSQVHDFLKGQDIRISRQQAKIQEIENRVEELREILRLKAIDYKIIEGLKDRRTEEFNIAQSKHEQKVADDMNMMRFKPGKGNE
jgi:flagellar FliJ protein